jgi:hypothetical protein
MSDPDRLTSRDDTIIYRDARDLVLRILVIACLGLIFWQAIIASGTP